MTATAVAVDPLHPERVFAGVQGSGLARSDDDGATWTQVTGDGVLTIPTPIELPDHRIAAVGMQTILVSDDQGKTWVPVTPALPYPPMTFTYSTFRKAFYISYFTCGAGVVPVPDNAVMSFPFDWEKK